MSELVIEGLRAAVAGREILSGIDLVVRSGEMHAVMGPNGAGKSTLGAVLLGHPDYEVLGGSVRLDGRELLSLPTWERAAAGLFLAPQDPTEIPGVPIAAVLAEALRAAGRSEDADAASLASRLSDEAADIGLSPALLGRPINAGASGGERKRVETLQLVALQPRIALLDELDSGLDIDALRQVARRVAAAVRAPRPGVDALGVLAVTHYTRLLRELQPDAVHILVHGRIVASGDASLADEIEAGGYAAYLPTPEPATRGGGLDDLFA